MAAKVSRPSGPILILSISAQSTVEAGKAEVLQLTTAGLASVVPVVLTAVVDVMVVATVEQADILVFVDYVPPAVVVEQVDILETAEPAVATEEELVMPGQVAEVAEVARPKVEDIGAVAVVVV